MYKSIMVPLDGTSFSEEALPTAIHLVRSNTARLVLARVMDRTTPSPLLTKPLAGQSWTEAPSDHAAIYLEKVAEHVLRTTGVRAQCVVLHGGIAASLRKEAAARHCDLIVMSTRVHGSVGRVVQRSIADRLVRSVACPVLLVRARGISFGLNVHRRFLHILVPLDGTPASESALDAALTIAEIDDARITVVHVAQPQLVAAGIAATPFANAFMGGSVEPEDVERMSSDYLDSVATRARLLHRRAGQYLAHGAPAEEILAFAERNAVDLIAMSTRAIGGVGRLVLGSTSTAVLHHASAAVMLVPQIAKV